MDSPLVRLLADAGHQLAVCFLTYRHDHILKAAGALKHNHFSSYHRLLSIARWSRDALGLCLFGMLRPLCSELLCLLSVDDTLCRKFGRKRMFGCGMLHDAISSSRNKAIINSGLNRVILALMVPPPCCPQRVFSLPIWCRLYLNHKAASRWRVQTTKYPERLESAKREPSRRLVECDAVRRDRGSSPVPLRQPGA